jgi:hypothetical protein
MVAAVPPDSIAPIIYLGRPNTMTQADQLPRPPSSFGTIRTVSAPAPNRVGHVFPHAEQTEHARVVPDHCGPSRRGRRAGVMGHANVATTRRLYAAGWREASERKRYFCSPAPRGKRTLEEPAIAN